MIYRIKNLAIISTFTVLASACSMDAGDMISIRVDQNASAMNSSPYQSLIAPPSSGTTWAVSAPSSTDGFECFVLNVMANDAILFNPGIEDFSTIEEIEADSCKTYAGAMSPMIPNVVGQPIFLEVQAPAGPDRYAQIVGLESPTGGCISHQSFYETLQQAPQDHYQDGIFEVGHARGDLFADTQIQITSDYDPNNTRPVGCGDGGSQVGADPIRISYDESLYMYAVSDASVSEPRNHIWPHRSCYLFNVRR